MSTRPVQRIMKHFILPITSKLALRYNIPMMTTYIHVYLTCTFTFINHWAFSSRPYRYQKRSISVTNLLYSQK